MRERVAHVEPDAPIIGMLRQSDGIIQAPVAHGALCKGDLHVGRVERAIE
jgi:hypothetical protein